MNSKIAKSISIICCYGLNDPKIRSPIEIDGLKTYFKQVVEHIAVNKNLHNSQSVVISGGYTWPYSSEVFANEYISESESSRKDILDSFKNQNIHLPILIETSAVTAFETLTFSLLTARKFDFEKVIIYCDKNFSQKITVFASKLFESIFDFEVIGLDRADIHPDSNLSTQTNIKLPEQLETNQFKFCTQLLQTFFSKRDSEHI